MQFIPTNSPYNSRDHHPHTNTRAAADHYEPVVELRKAEHVKVIGARLAFFGCQIEVTYDIWADKKQLSPSVQQSPLPVLHETSPPPLPVLQE